MHSNDFVLLSEIYPGKQSAAPADTFLPHSDGLTLKRMSNFFSERKKKKALSPAFFSMCSEVPNRCLQFPMACKARLGPPPQLREPGVWGPGKEAFFFPESICFSLKPLSLQCFPHSFLLKSPAKQGKKKQLRVKIIPFQCACPGLACGTALGVFLPSHHHSAIVGCGTDLGH